MKWLEDEHFVTRRVNREIRRCLSQCRASKKMYRWTAKTNSILVSDLGKFSPSMESQRKWLKNGKDQLLLSVLQRIKENDRGTVEINSRFPFKGAVRLKGSPIKESNWRKNGANLGFSLRDHAEWLFNFSWGVYQNRVVCVIGKLLLTTFKKFMHDKKSKIQTVFSLDDNVLISFSCGKCIYFFNWWEPW